MNAYRLTACQPLGALAPAVRIDAWMTEDRIAGLDEERAFRTAYDRKMGLDEETMTSIAPQLQRFIAPYAAAMKKVGAKAQDLRGIPLRTTISVSVGGAHCAAARQNQESGGVTANAGHAAQAAAENSTTAAIGAAAEQAVSHSTGGSLVGSIAGSAADTAPLFSITTETTEIRSDSIPGDQFELPTGWTLRQPKPAAERPEFSCPAAGA